MTTNHRPKLYNDRQLAGELNKRTAAALSLPHDELPALAAKLFDRLGAIELVRLCCRRLEVTGLTHLATELSKTLEMNCPRS